MFESVALPTAVEYLLPEIRLGELWTVLGAPVYLGFVLIGVAGALVMTWVNLRGLEVAARVQSLVTVVILVSGVLLFAGALTFGSVSNARPLFTPGAGGVLSVLIMVPALLVGFDVIPQAAEEIDLPPRRIGVLLVVSVVVAVLWYAGVSYSVALAYPPGTAPAAEMATADAASVLWSHPAAGTILVLGGVGDILTSWNAFLIGGSRVILVLARSGALPEVRGLYKWKLFRRYFGRD
jgi:amino acid transporter